MLRKTWFRHSSALLLYLLSNAAFSQEGKLIATAGLVQLEGSGGGGIVP